MNPEDLYFATEVVNRVSFLREDSDFVHDSVLHPSARFIFFHSNNPLIHKYSPRKLIIMSNGDNQIDGEAVKKGLGHVPGWRSAIEAWSDDNRDQNPDLREPGKPVLLFLGLQDESVGLDIQTLKFSDSADETYLDFQGRYQGIPYYAVDVTNAPELADKVQAFFVEQSGGDGSKSFVDNGVMFTHSRKHTLGFHKDEAALYSHASMFLDWIARNRFCPGCGTKVIPIHAGGKLFCSLEDTTKCPVKSARVSNVSFPRTDAVVITAVTSVDRSKILLSLSKRHAATGMYACTAGFMEPSESVEVATKREIWEETGVKCSKINIVMTQPWPFPGNLMIGCIAEVEFNGENEVVHLGHDKELSDAKWFDTDFIKKLVYQEELAEDEQNVLIPFPESIAHQLIKLVVDQRVKGKL